MGKKRIYELAKELNQNSKDVVNKAQKLGIDVKNHMGAVSEDDERKIRSSFKPANPSKPANNPVKQTVAKVKTDTHGKQPAKQTSPAEHQGNKAPIKKTVEASKQPTSTTDKKIHTPRPQEQRGQGQNQNRPQNQGQHKPQGQQSQGQNRPQGQNQNRPQGQGQNRPQNQNRTQNQNRNQNTRPQTGQNNQSNRGGGQGGQPRTSTQGNQQRTSVDNRQQGQVNRQGGQRVQQQTEQRSGQGQQSQSQGQRGGQNFKSRNNQYNQSFNNQNRRNNKKGKKGKPQQPAKPAVPPRKFRELPEVLVFTDGMTVADLAKKLHREPAEIIKKLFMMGVMSTQNQSLDKEAIELLAADYGIESEEKVQVDVADIEKFFEPENISQENLVTRPPVVTIMGHVDHGKTTLLDTLRHSKVSLGEAGGITQHIGAYQVDVHGKTITFLDTPGHAAFTSMRARGAKITDITILVVAADDGVMPQTVEAINHAKAAEVPIIVAVNKIDKPGANPDRVMQELSEHGLIPEDWGGDTIFVKISAKFNENIDELLEMILLVAEVEDLKANPNQRAIGTVIEARLDKGKGPIATLLVQQGTLKVGDPIVAGNTFGRVRVMVNDIGRRDKAAGPATPVEITGLNDVPQAGDHFVVYEDEKTARAAGEERAKRALIRQRSASSRVTLDNLFESLKEGELKEVNVIIKADVQGSAEALAASLNKIDVEGVRVKIVHSAVGAINESDITLAEASNAIMIGFNVRPTPQAKVQAESDEVDIRLHSIIYKVIDEIETAMKGMLDPEFEERITGQMIVRELYKVSKVGTIAGCYVTDGSIQRDSGVRVIRDGIVIFEGKLASLKRFKDDAKEVKLGFECGAMVENFNDLKVDDIIEGFVMEEIKKN